MVDIFVGFGVANTPFSVYQKFLSDKVPRSKKVFRGGFKEGVEQSAELPEDDPAVFSLIMVCLYKDQISPLDTNKNDAEGGLCLGHFKLYIFSEDICNEILQDYTLTFWMPNFAEHKKHPIMERTYKVYESLAPASPLRKFLA